MVITRLLGGIAGGSFYSRLTTSLAFESIFWKKMCRKYVDEGRKDEKDSCPQVRCLDLGEISMSHQVVKVMAKSEIYRAK
jgi:hypothetical protein